MKRKENEWKTETLKCHEKKRCIFIDYGVNVVKYIC